MSKIKPIRKYYIWSSSYWWVWISISFSVGGFIWTIIRSINKYQDTQFLIAAITFMVSLLCTILLPTLKNTKVIKDAYGEDLLWKAINVFLENKEYHLNDNNRLNDNKFKYIQLLNEACDLPYTRANLQLDGKPYDEFFNMQGSISITDASIFAWKYPEYSWFLISQYAASLFKQCQDKCGGEGSLHVEDRYDDSRKMKVVFKEHLKTSYSSPFDYNSFTRVYLLTKKDFESNKSMIEQFVAGHTLFGINIFIIDKEKFLSDEQRKSVYKKMIEYLNSKKFDELPKEKQYLDTMCYKKKNNDAIFYTYIDSSTHNVEEKELKDMDDTNDTEGPTETWNSLVEKIQKITTNTKSSSMLLYPKGDDYVYSKKCEHKINEKKSALIFEKKR